MDTDRTDTTPRPDATQAVATAGPPIALAVAGALFAIGGLLHPKGDPVAQLVDPIWPAAHLSLLVGLVVLIPALLAIVKSRGSAWAPPVRTAAFVTVGAAALGLVEMVPHLLASSEAQAVAGGGPTPLYDMHQQIGLFSNLLVGLSIAVLAVLAARAKSLGGGALLAVLAVLGGVSFGLAALLLVTTGIDAFAILFAGSVLIGLWLLASGILLARQRQRAVA